MQIGKINTNNEILVVAEIGNNHEGSYDAAKKMVMAAAEAGAQAVKFQTFRAELYLERSDKERFDRYKSYELSFGQFRNLAELAKSLGMLFISTPLDLESAEFLSQIVDAFKIASGDNNFYPLLEKVAETGKPIIISSGMSDFSQVRRSVKFVQEFWKRNHITAELAVLHCVSKYPVLPEEANLRSVEYLYDHLENCTVGYSDHTDTPLAAIAAAAMGARIIEKHFTLDKSRDGLRDHKLSADPKELREIVQTVKCISKMLGNYEKNVQACETDTIAIARRSIVAAKDLKAGHVIAKEDLICIRPAGGIPPEEQSKVLGKKLTKSVKFQERVLYEDLS